MACRRGHARGPLEYGHFGGPRKPFGCSVVAPVGAQLVCDRLTGDPVLDAWTQHSPRTFGEGMRQESRRQALPPSGNLLLCFCWSRVGNALWVGTALLASCNQCWNLTKMNAPDIIRLPD